MGALQTQGPVLELINNPKLLGLLENATVMNVLRQVDPKDLYQYLVTGKSAKYAGEKLLGRWRLLPSDTYITARRANPDMSPKQMRAIKTFVAVFLNGMTFMATPEKRVYLKLNFKPQARALLKAVQDAQKAAQNAANMADPYGGYGMDAATTARYGLGPGPQQQQEQKPRAKGGLPDLPGGPDLNIAGTGSWEKRGPRYTIRYKDTKGRDRRGTIEVDDEIMKLTIDNMTLVFLRTMLQAQ